MWDPKQYAAFKDERARPFFELLGRIPDRPYGEIVDLGCGTGELTRVLAERWPEAKVTGLDSSPEMLAQAASRATAGAPTFEEGDIAGYGRPADLVFSNAALHWLGDHPALIPRLAGLVRPGGVFAVQMPSNFYARSHMLLTETARTGPWAPKLAYGWRPLSVHPLDYYVRLLQDLGARVDAWETEYYQVLEGENAVFEWVKGSALRPVLALLDGAEREAFEAAYAARLRAAYPAAAQGTLFPFKRVFWVATR